MTELRKEGLAALVYKKYGALSALLSRLRFGAFPEALSCSMFSFAAQDNFVWSRLEILIKNYDDILRSYTC